MPAEHTQGLLDTNIGILRKWLDPAELPAEVAIAAITLADCPRHPTRCAGTRNRATTTNTPNGAGVSASCNVPRTSSTPPPSTLKPLALTAESAQP